jgi:hypothetical protein
MKRKENNKDITLWIGRHSYHLIDAGTYVVGHSLHCRLTPTLSVASNQGASGAGPGSRVGGNLAAESLESGVGLKK